MSLLDIARERDVPIRFLVAFRAVESAGDPHALRFEPHLFKLHRPRAVLTLARLPLHPSPSIVALRSKERIEAWAHGLIPYTPGYDHAGNPRAASSSSEETDRAAFERARAIDASDAVLSTSFGTYQALGGAFQAILPQHRLLVSDEDAEAAIRAWDANPRDVSDALLGEWLRDNPKACDAMRRGDEREAISRYNGCELERDASGHVCGDGGCASYLVRFRRALAAYDSGSLSL